MGKLDHVIQLAEAQGREALAQFFKENKAVIETLKEKEIESLYQKIIKAQKGKEFINCISQFFGKKNFTELTDLSISQINHIAKLVNENRELALLGKRASVVGAKDRPPTIHEPAMVEVKDQEIPEIKIDMEKNLSNKYLGFINLVIQGDHHDLLQIVTNPANQNLMMDKLRKCISEKDVNNLFNQLKDNLSQYDRKAFLSDLAAEKFLPKDHELGDNKKLKNYLIKNANDIFDHLFLVGEKSEGIKGFFDNLISEIDPKKNKKDFIKAMKKYVVSIGDQADEEEMIGRDHDLDEVYAENQSHLPGGSAVESKSASKGKVISSLSPAPVADDKAQIRFQAIEGTKKLNTIIDRAKARRRSELVQFLEKNKEAISIAFENLSVDKIELLYDGVKHLEGREFVEVVAEFFGKKDLKDLSISQMYQIAKISNENKQYTLLSKPRVAGGAAIHFSIIKKVGPTAVSDEEVSENKEDTEKNEFLKQVKRLCDEKEIKLNENDIALIDSHYHQFQKNISNSEEIKKILKKMGLSNKETKFINNIGKIIFSAIQYQPLVEKLFKDQNMDLLHIVANPANKTLVINKLNELDTLHDLVKELNKKINDFNRQSFIAKIRSEQFEKSPNLEFSNSKILKKYLIQNANNIFDYFLLTSDTSNKIKDFFEMFLPTLGSRQTKSREAFKISMKEYGLTVDSEVNEIYAEMQFNLLSNLEKGSISDSYEHARPDIVKLLTHPSNKQTVFDRLKESKESIYHNTVNRVFLLDLAEERKSVDEIRESMQAIGLKNIHDDSKMDSARELFCENQYLWMLDQTIKPALKEILKREAVKEKLINLFREKNTHEEVLKLMIDFSKKPESKEKLSGLSDDEVKHLEEISKDFAHTAYEHIDMVTSCLFDKLREVFELAYKENRPQLISFLSKLVMSDIVRDSSLLQNESSSKKENVQSYFSRLDIQLTGPMLSKVGGLFGALKSLGIDEKSEKFKVYYDAIIEENIKIDKKIKNNIGSFLSNFGDKLFEKIDEKELIKKLGADEKLKILLESLGIDGKSERFKKYHEFMVEKISELRLKKSQPVLDEKVDLSETPLELKEMKIDLGISIGKKDKIVIQEKFVRDILEKNGLNGEMITNEQAEYINELTNTMDSSNSRRESLIGQLGLIICASGVMDTAAVKAELEKTCDDNIPYLIFAREMNKLLPKKVDSSVNLPILDDISEAKQVLSNAEDYLHKGGSAEVAVKNKYNEYKIYGNEMSNVIDGETKELKRIGQSITALSNILLGGDSFILEQVKGLGANEAKKLFKEVIDLTKEAVIFYAMGMRERAKQCDQLVQIKLGLNRIGYIDKLGRNVDSLKKAIENANAKINQSEQKLDYSEKLKLLNDAAELCQLYQSQVTVYGNPKKIQEEIIHNEKLMRYATKNHENFEEKSNSLLGYLEKLDDVIKLAESKRANLQLENPEKMDHKDEITQRMPSRSVVEAQNRKIAALSFDGLLQETKRNGDKVVALYDALLNKKSWTEDSLTGIMVGLDKYKIRANLYANRVNHEFNNIADKRNIELMSNIRKINYFLANIEKKYNAVKKEYDEFNLSQTVRKRGGTVAVTPSLSDKSKGRLSIVIEKPPVKAKKQSIIGKAAARLFGATPDDSKRHVEKASPIGTTSASSLPSSATSTPPSSSDSRSPSPLTLDSAETKSFEHKDEKVNVVGRELPLSSSATSTPPNSSESRSPSPSTPISSPVPSPRVPQTLSQQMVTGLEGLRERMKPTRKDYKDAKFFDGINQLIKGVDGLLKNNKGIDIQQVSNLINGVEDFIANYFSGNKNAIQELEKLEPSDKNLNTQFKKFLNTAKEAIVERDKQAMKVLAEKHKQEMKALEIKRENDKKAARKQRKAEKAANKKVKKEASDRRKAEALALKKAKKLEKNAVKPAEIPDVFTVELLSPEEEKKIFDQLSQGDAQFDASMGQKTSTPTAIEETKDKSSSDDLSDIEIEMIDDNGLPYEKTKEDAAVETLAADTQHDDKPVEEEKIKQIDQDFFSVVPSSLLVAEPDDPKVIQERMIDRLSKFKGELSPEISGKKYKKLSEKVDKFIKRIEKLVGKIGIAEDQFHMILDCVRNIVAYAVFDNSIKEFLKGKKEIDHNAYQEILHGSSQLVDSSKNAVKSLENINLSDKDVKKSLSTFIDQVKEIVKNQNKQKKEALNLLVKYDRKIKNTQSRAASASPTRSKRAERSISQRASERRSSDSDIKSAVKPAEIPDVFTVELLSPEEEQKIFGQPSQGDTRFDASVEQKSPTATAMKETKDKTPSDDFSGIEIEIVDDYGLPDEKEKKRDAIETVDVDIQHHEETIEKEETKQIDQNFFAVVPSSLLVAEPDDPKLIHERMIDRLSKFKGDLSPEISGRKYKKLSEKVDKFIKRIEKLVEKMGISEDQFHMMLGCVRSIVAYTISDNNMKEFLKGKKEIDHSTYQGILRESSQLVEYSKSVVQSLENVKLSDKDIKKSLSTFIEQAKEIVKNQNKQKEAAHGLLLKYDKKRKNTKPRAASISPTRSKEAEGFINQKKSERRASDSDIKSELLSKREEQKVELSDELDDFVMVSKNEDPIFSLETPTPQPEEPVRLSPLSVSEQAMLTTKEGVAEHFKRFLADYAEPRSDYYFRANRLLDIILGDDKKKPKLTGAVFDDIMQKVSQILISKDKAEPIRLLNEMINKLENYHQSYKIFGWQLGGKNYFKDKKEFLSSLNHFLAAANLVQENFEEHELEEKYQTVPEKSPNFVTDNSSVSTVTEMNLNALIDSLPNEVIPRVDRESLKKLIENNWLGTSNFVQACRPDQAIVDYVKAFSSQHRIIGVVTPAIKEDSLFDQEGELKPWVTEILKQSTLPWNDKVKREFSDFFKVLLKESARFVVDENGRMQPWLELGRPKVGRLGDLDIVRHLGDDIYNIHASMHSTSKALPALLSALFKYQSESNLRFYVELNQLDAIVNKKILPYEMKEVFPLRDNENLNKIMANLIRFGMVSLAEMMSNPALDTGSLSSIFKNINILIKNPDSQQGIHALDELNTLLKVSLGDMYKPLSDFIAVIEGNVKLRPMVIPVEGHPIELPADVASVMIPNVADLKHFDKGLNQNTASKLSRVFNEAELQALLESNIDRFCSYYTSINTDLDRLAAVMPSLQSGVSDSPFDDHGDFKPWARGLFNTNEIEPISGFIGKLLLQSYVIISDDHGNIRPWVKEYLGKERYDRAIENPEIGLTQLHNQLIAGVAQCLVGGISNNRQNDGFSHVLTGLAHQQINMNIECQINLSVLNKTLKNKDQINDFLFEKASVLSEELNKIVISLRDRALQNSSKISEMIKLLNDVLIQPNAKEASLSLAELQIILIEFNEHFKDKDELKDALSEFIRVGKDLQSMFAIPDDINRINEKLQKFGVILDQKIEDRIEYKSREDQQKMVHIVDRLNAESTSISDISQFMHSLGVIPDDSIHHPAVVAMFIENLVLDPAIKNSWQPFKQEIFNHLMNNSDKLADPDYLEKIKNIFNHIDIRTIEESLRGLGLSDQSKAVQDVIDESINASFDFHAAQLQPILQLVLERKKEGKDQEHGSLYRIFDGVNPTNVMMGQNKKFYEQNEFKADFEVLRPLADPENIDSPFDDNMNLKPWVLDILPDGIKQNMTKFLQDKMSYAYKMVVDSSGHLRPWLKDQFGESIFKQAIDEIKENNLIRYFVSAALMPMTYSVVDADNPVISEFVRSVMGRQRRTNEDFLKKLIEFKSDLDLELNKKTEFYLEAKFDYDNFSKRAASLIANPMQDSGVLLKAITEAHKEFITERAEFIKEQQSKDEKKADTQVPTTSSPVATSVAGQATTSTDAASPPVSLVSPIIVNLVNPPPVLTGAVIVSSPLEAPILVTRPAPSVLTSVLGSIPSLESPSVASSIPPLESPSAASSSPASESFSVANSTAPSVSPSIASPPPPVPAKPLHARTLSQSAPAVAMTSTAQISRLLNPKDVVKKCLQAVSQYANQDLAIEESLNHLARTSLGETLFGAAYKNDKDFGKLKKLILGELGKARENIDGVHRMIVNEQEYHAKYKPKDVILPKEKLSAEMSDSTLPDNHYAINVVLNSKARFDEHKKDSRLDVFTIKPPETIDRRKMVERALNHPDLAKYQHRVSSILKVWKEYEISSSTNVGAINKEAFADLLKKKFRAESGALDLIAERLVEGEYKKNCIQTVNGVIIPSDDYLSYYDKFIKRCVGQNGSDKSLYWDNGDDQVANQAAILICQVNGIKCKSADLKLNLYKPDDVAVVNEAVGERLTALGLNNAFNISLEDLQKELQQVDFAELEKDPSMAPVVPLLRKIKDEGELTTQEAARELEAVSARLGASAA